MYFIKLSILLKMTKFIDEENNYEFEFIESLNIGSDLRSKKSIKVKNGREENDLLNIMSNLQISLGTIEEDHLFWISTNVIPSIFSYSMKKQDFTDIFNACWIFKEIYIIERKKERDIYTYTIIIESLKNRHILIKTKIPRDYNIEDNYLTLGILNYSKLQNFYNYNSYYDLKIVGKMKVIKINSVFKVENFESKGCTYCCYIGTCICIPHIIYLLLEECFCIKSMKCDCFCNNDSSEGCNYKLRSLCMNFSLRRMRYVDQFLCYCNILNEETIMNNSITNDINHIKEIIDSQPNNSQSIITHIESPPSYNENSNEFISPPMYSEEEI